MQHAHTHTYMLMCMQSTLRTIFRYKSQTFYKSTEKYRNTRMENPMKSWNTPEMAFYDDGYSRQGL